MLVVELLTPALLDLLAGPAARQGVRYLDMAACYRTDKQVAALRTRGFSWLNYADCQPVFEEQVAELRTRLAAAWGRAAAGSAPGLAGAAEFVATPRQQEQFTACLQAAAHRALERTAFLLARLPELPGPVQYLPADGFWRALALLPQAPPLTVPLWWQRWLAVREAGSAWGLWLRQYHSAAVRLLVRRCGLRRARPRPVFPQPTLFFVHQDICYGNKLFVKNHLYAEATASELHPRRIAHLFLERPDPRSRRYLRLIGSPAIVPTELRYRRPAAMFARALGWLRRARRVLASAAGSDGAGARVMLQLAGDLLQYEEYLALFPRARRAVADYDLVFPRALGLALNRAGIPCVGIQERTAVSRYYHQFMVFDHYFIWGDYDEQLLRRAGRHAIGSVYPLGPPRADLVYDEVRSRRELPGYVVPPQRCLIAVFDNHAAPGAIADGFRGRVSFHSLGEFYAGILRVARACPEACFVFKGKFTEWTWPGPLEATGEALQAQANVRFETRLRRCPPYRLAARAALTIVQHTSVGEEALAAGRRVLFFDNERFLRWHEHPLLRAGVVVETAEELIAAVKRGLAADAGPAWTEPLQELYGGRNNGTTRARVRAALTGIGREVSAS